MILLQVTLSPNLLVEPNGGQDIKTVEGDDNSRIQSTPTKELGTIDLFKHPGSRNVTLIMCVNWMAVTLGMIYFYIRNIF